MSAKATDPLIVPAIDTMESSLLVTVHFYLKQSLNSIDRPKMAVRREITHISNSNAIKVKEITSVVR